MARTLTANMLAKTQQDLATEPINIIAIEWYDGTIYYSDKTFSLGSYNCQGKILSLSSLSSTGKQDSTGDVSSLTVSLDDTDGTLKTKINTIQIEGTAATVYQYYEGLTSADPVILFSGRIIAPTVWSEGERQLTFSIESIVEDAEIGFAPTKDDLPDLSDDAVGKAWPICFGTVLKVPAIRIYKPREGRNSERIYGGYPSYEADTTIQIEGGSSFPQSTSLDLVIGTVIFRGSFNGDVFTRSSSNLKWYSNVPLAARPSGNEDEYNTNVCWVTAGYNLMNKYCYHPDIGFRECILQEGTKCTFSQGWSTLLDSTNTFSEVRGVTHSSWYVAPQTLNYWYVKEGRTARLLNQVNEDIYVCNLYPSTEILEVFAYRKYGDTEIFAPVPSSYYTKELSYSVAGYNITAIKFTTPLEDYEGEGWSGDIYISLRSTLSTNVADIIEGLFTNFTSYSIDSTSFTSVKSKVNYYPANFVLQDQENIISLAEDIAWQARCALFIRNGIVSIKYLSETPTVNYDLTNQDVLFKSLNLDFTSTDDLVTRITAKYRLDYSEREELELVYRNNIDIYGLRSLEREIYIYNDPALVAMTLNFWGYRYSNSWRLYEIVTFLRTLSLEVYDCVRTNVSIISTRLIRSIIEDISHDSTSNLISLKGMLASKAGDNVSGQPAEDANFWTGDPSNPVTPVAISDPGASLKEVDYDVPIVPDNESNASDGENKYKFQFIYPEIDDEVERSIDFPVRVELYYDNNTRAYETVDAKLSVHSEDPLDVWDFNNDVEYTITLTSGIWEDNAQIINGTTEQYGFLSVVHITNDENYEPATVDIKIINEKTGVLAWDTNPPASTQRGVAFPIAISGGTGGASEVIKLLPTFADASDKVYDNATGTELTEITLNASGEYSGSWYIYGGSGDDTTNLFTLYDDTYGKYADSASTTFNIMEPASGNTYIKTVTQDIQFLQYVEANSPVLELTHIDGILGEDEIFHLLVTLKDSDGNTINHSGNVTLYAKAVDDSNLFWLQPSSGPALITAMTAGTALGAGTDCEVQVTPTQTGPATITASIVYNGDTLTDSVSVPIKINKTIAQLIEFLQLAGVSQKVDLSQTIGFDQSLNISREYIRAALQTFELAQTLELVLPQRPNQDIDFDQAISLAGSLYNKSTDQTLTLDQAVDVLQTFSRELNQAIAFAQSIAASVTYGLGHTISFGQAVDVAITYLRTLGQTIDFDQVIALNGTWNQDVEQSIAFTQDAWHGHAESIIQTLTFTQTVIANFTSIVQILEFTQSVIATKGFPGNTGGFIAGANLAVTDAQIQYLNFANDSTTTYAGDLAEDHYGMTGHSSMSHGYCAGAGNTSSVKTIQRYPFATTTTCSDIGDLATTVQYSGGVSSPTAGYCVSRSGIPEEAKKINKFLFASSTNGVVSNELNTETRGASGHSSASYGYCCSGNGTTAIQYFSYSSSGTATTIGNLSAAKYLSGGVSSTTYGYNFGATTANGIDIDKFSFASGTVSKAGELTVNTANLCGISQSSYGYACNGSGTYDNIDKFSTTSDNDASSVGTMYTDDFAGAGSQY